MILNLTLTHQKKDHQKIDPCNNGGVTLKFSLKMRRKIINTDQCEEDYLKGNVPN